MSTERSPIASTVSRLATPRLPRRIAARTTLGDVSMRFSDPCTLAFYRLQEMVARAETRRPLRTIEEEDLIALEDLILLEEGPDILVKYQRSWGAGVG